MDPDSPTISDFFSILSFQFSAGFEEFIVPAASGQATDVFLQVSFLKWFVESLHRGWVNEKLRKVCVACAIGFGRTSGCATCRRAAPSGRGSFSASRQRCSSF